MQRFFIDKDCIEIKIWLKIVFVSWANLGNLVCCAIETLNSKFTQLRLRLYIEAKQLFKINFRIKFFYLFRNLLSLLEVKLTVCTLEYRYICLENWMFNWHYVILSLNPEFRIPIHEVESNLTIIVDLMSSGGSN